MPIISSLMLQELAVGTHETESVQIAGNYWSPTVTVDITEHLDPATQMVVSLYASVNGGSSWEYAGGFRRHGGVSLNPATGLPETEVVYKGRVEIAVYENGVKTGVIPRWINPLVKAEIQVSGAPLVTKLAVG